MIDEKTLKRPHCSQTGILDFEDYCYILKCDDGTSYWLEMDRIPMHLVERPVRVDGMLFPRNLISVEAIGPAEQ